MAKVFVGKSRFGRGVFSARDIKNGEFLFTATGKIYHAEKASLLPFYQKNHAVQIGSKSYISSSKSFPCNTNHSCSPNIGIIGLRKFYALRDIKKGEEITFDYSTTENSDWYCKCKCGNKKCRKFIGPWRELFIVVKKKYLKMGIVSSWIVKKYKYR